MFSTALRAPLPSSSHPPKLTFDTQVSRERLVVPMARPVIGVNPPKTPKKGFLRRLADKFRPPVPPPPVPAFGGREQREAALRERGLLPQKDLSQQEAERDARLPYAVAAPFAAFSVARSDESAARQVQEEWQKRNAEGAPAPETPRDLNNPPLPRHHSAAALDTPCWSPTKTVTEFTRLPSPELQRTEDCHVSEEGQTLIVPPPLSSTLSSPLTVSSFHTAPEIASSARHSGRTTPAPSFQTPRADRSSIQRSEDATPFLASATASQSTFPEESSSTMQHPIGSPTLSTFSWADTMATLPSLSSCTAGSTETTDSGLRTPGRQSFALAPVPEFDVADVNSVSMSSADAHHHRPGLFGHLRKQLGGTGKPKHGTYAMTSGHRAASAARSRLPSHARGPTDAERKMLGDRQPHEGRAPLPVQYHNRSTIVQATDRIEDEESRRLTEVAFLA